MASINQPTHTAARQTLTTHEGAPAKRITPAQELERTVMACLLWEDQFYEGGVSIAKRIKDLVERVEPIVVSDLAVKARHQMYLRHVPLLLIRELARRDLSAHDGLVKAALPAIIQRADELAEFLAIYWKDGKQPLSSQVKKGLAKAFQRFDAYQLAKYDRPGAVRLRDVLFLCHAEPKDEEQAAIWKQLIDGTLPTPDTWETTLSASGGEDKQVHWTRLLTENKLGGLALLRNLRNMGEAKVGRSLIRKALTDSKFKRVLPFRFLAAARYAPVYEPELEAGMFKVCADLPKLSGATAILVDTSGSMQAQLSERSQMKRADAAAALAMIVREICDSVDVIAFASTAQRIAPRRGFGLYDAINKPDIGYGTNMEKGKLLADDQYYDRIIIVSDEQSHQALSGPKDGKPGYMLNVASYKNGVGYGRWTHIDGWSENIVRYITALEGVQ